MKLKESDIIAMANARVSQAENKKSNYWIFGVVIALIVSIFLMKISTIAGYAVIVSAVVAFYFYLANLKKKQIAEQHKLLAEWNKEQKENEKAGEVHGS